MPTRGDRPASQMPREETKVESGCMIPNHGKEDELGVKEARASDDLLRLQPPSLDAYIV